MMPLFELLPNWQDDPQGEAVLKLLMIAFREDDYQSMAAAEVLLACCFPSYCGIDPTNLQSLEPDTFNAALKVIDLNYKGFYAHQVIAEGNRIFEALKEAYLRASQSANAVLDYVTDSQAVRH